MKNILWVIMFFVLSFLIIPQVHAASLDTSPTPTILPTTQEESTITEVEYVLPYPGILPDHPLYFLKQVRDKILEFLVVDPIRKMELYILQADKRLGMGIMLVTAKKNKLAETTLAEGEKYANLAISLFSNLKNSGKSIPVNVVEQLEKSNTKHIEVLEELLSKASEAQKSALAGPLEFAKKIQQDLAKIK